MSVDYAKQREQFGRPDRLVPGDQAHARDAQGRPRVRAQPVVYRAAHSRRPRPPDPRRPTSRTAKIAAAEAAPRAAKIALQVHGAIGYTWEQDLHVWMTRAWTLDLAWGETAWHRKRLADAVFDDTLPVESFGFSPSRADRPDAGGHGASGRVFSHSHVDRRPDATARTNRGPMSSNKRRSASPPSRAGSTSTRRTRASSAQGRRLRDLLLPEGRRRRRNPGFGRHAAATRCRLSRPRHALVLHRQPLQAAGARTCRPTRSCRTRSRRSS